MSNFVTVSWAGPLALCRTEIRRIPEGVPGIYVLQVFDPKAGMYPAIYVGKSTRLRRRLCEHADTDSTSPDFAVVRFRMATYFSAAPILRAELRDAVEAALIALLRPPCNRQVPMSVRVFPNLPPSIPFID